MPTVYPHVGFAKSFMANLNLKDNFKIITNDSDDPTVVAKDAPQGSLYMRDGTTDFYLKMDNGSSVNWEMFGSFADMMEFYGNIQDDPTGFPTDRTQSTITTNDGTREVTISPTGASFTFYQKGTPYTKTAESVVVPNVEGEHFIYYNNGVLSTTTTFNRVLIVDYVIVAVVRWDATNAKFIFLGDERHGHKMPSVVHYYLHNSFRARYSSGLALGDFTLDASGDVNAHAQFSVASGRFYDEDIELTPSTVALAALSIPVWYNEGATPVLRRQDPTGYAVRSFSGGAGRLAFNEFTGGAWQQTEVTNSNYVLGHVFATNDINYPIEAVQGQAQYGTIALARAGATTEINSLITTGLPTAEWVPLATVIFQTVTSYANAVKARIRTTDTGGAYVDWRSSGLSAGATPTDHGNLAGLVDDDHLQYSRVPTTSTVTGSNSITPSTTRNSLFIANSAGGDVTFNLDALATFPDGFQFSILKLVEANTMIINPHGAETINGIADITLKEINEFRTITKTASEWKSTPYTSFNNLIATAAPTTGDDINDGYNRGSLWYDATNNILYIAESVSAGAAVWTEIITSAATQTLTNKYLTSASVLHRTATARDVGFDQSGQTNTTKLTLVTPITANRSATFPDRDGTIAMTGEALKTNYIDNPIMQINQRRVTTTPTSSATYGSVSLDRWKMDLTTITANVAIVQNTGSRYYADSAKLIATNTTSGVMAFFQILEDQTNYAGKTWTLSAKVKSNNANTKIRIYHDSTSTTGTSHTGGGAYEFLTVTITPTTNITQVYIGVISAAVTTNDYVEMTEIQLEYGSVRTDMVARRLDEELRKCQRHFVRWYQDATNYHTIGVTRQADIVNLCLVHPVEMRSTPVLSVLSNPAFTVWHDGTGNLNVSLYLSSKSSTSMEGYIAIGLTKDKDTNLVYLNTNNWLQLSAEA